MRVRLVAMVLGGLLALGAIAGGLAADSTVGTLQWLGVECIGVGVIVLAIAAGER